MSERAASVHSRLDLPASATMIALCLCWAVQQVTVKVALAGGLPPFWQSGFRSAGAAVLLLLWAWARRDRSILRFDDGTLAPGLWAALFFTGEVLLLFAGLAHTTAARGVLFLYTAPFVVAIGAHFFVPNERLRWTAVLGLVVAFVGIVTAVAGGLTAPSGQKTLLGDLLTLGSGMCWGAGTVVVKASRLTKASAAKVTLYQLVGSVPPLFAAALLLPQGAFAPTPLAWLMLAYQTVFVAFISYAIWFFLIARYPAGKLAVFSCLTPPLGAAAGAILLGEPISASFALAVLLVAIGIWLVNVEGRIAPD